MNVLVSAERSAFRLTTTFANKFGDQSSYTVLSFHDTSSIWRVIMTLVFTIGATVTL